MTMKTRLKHDASRELFARASRVIAGGESSSVRVTDDPLVIVSAQGARFTDADGNRYIDYQIGFGPLIFGHGHPAIVRALKDQLDNGGMQFAMPHSLNHEVGERIVALVPSVEQVRFANSGTEAAASTVRTARVATGRTKILKFEGHYHGWSDTLFTALHPTLQDLGDEKDPNIQPAVGGLPDGCLAETLQCSWNRRDLVRSVMERHGEDVACIITEPVMSNSGVIGPKGGYLQFLRELCDQYGSLLVFDEVITGFRHSPGGAQARFGVLPDLTVMGKALGGGVPVAAFGGREDIMRLHADGRAFHGGTYAGNPLSLAGARAALDLVRDGGERMYADLDRRTERLAEGVQAAVSAAGLHSITNVVGPIMQIFFVGPGAGSISSYREAAAAVPDHDVFRRFTRLLLDEGVYVHPDQWEQWFVSFAHSDEDIEETISAAEIAAARLAEELSAGN